MAAQKVFCPECGCEISIDDVLTKQIEERITHDLSEKHQAELHKVLEEKQAVEATAAKKLEEETRLIKEKSLQEAIVKVRQQYDAKIESTKAEASEQEKLNKDLQEQVKELLKQNRDIKSQKEQLDLEYQKKLAAEEEEIKRKAREQAQEELTLKIAEKDKKLADVLKANEELRRKLEQGSQQLQGEVQELKLEEQLKTAFPFDEIREVPKGIRGADVIQVVHTQHGTVCGTIVWESKNTTNWSAGWIQKLKEDQRALKAELAIIVTKVLPPTVKTFGMEEGVFVTDMASALGVGHLLRQQLLGIKSAQIVNEGKATKAEVVYNYLTSNDFKQRMDVWVEYFRNRREELDRERLYYTKKWEKEEKSMMKVIENTAGIYGDLQGLIGNALPKITYLELPEITE